MGIEHMKKCKKCGEIFDIGTNYDLCPDCRNTDTIKQVNVYGALRKKGGEQ